MTKFSIIVPVYNVMPYIKECLDSLVTQNYKDYEICIVDDGSTDGSGEICDEYKNKFPCIKLLHQPNQGVSVARNNALDMASGDYIWFVDADDYITGDVFEYLNKIIAMHRCDTIIFGNEQPDSIVKNYNCETSAKNDILTNHICYCNPLMLFSRSVIERNKLRFTIGMKMAEDLEFQYKYLINCDSPVAIPYNFYHIRERIGSASRNQSSLTENASCNKLLLSNIAQYLQTINCNNEKWLSSRITERLKCFLQSSITSRNQNLDDSQTLFRKYINLYKDLGYKNISTWSLNVAYFNIHIYALLFRLFLIIKGRR